MFTEKDIHQIHQKGLDQSDVEAQINNFKQGFPFIQLYKPALIDNGIKKLSEDEVFAYSKLYDDLKIHSIKFVPASGAASRMFKFLLEFYKTETINEDVKYFFENIKSFAFYKELEKLISSHQLSIDELVKNKDHKKILDFFLFDNGLNYSQKPKGVLQFHKYANDVRTAFEEHLVEGAKYSKYKNEVNIHFTISPEHEYLFKDLLNQKQKIYEKSCGVSFNISFSQQKPSTDMIAVDFNNKLFRNNDGSLLFRPGGHGALIENLNDLDAEIIFIKNIDNVVPDKLKEDTIKYKKALAGVLISFRDQIFEYLNDLNSNNLDEEKLTQIGTYINEELCFIFEKNRDREAYINQLKEILNRPIRVCGMVKNEGEPGGGPFWVKHKNGNVDLQIVETSQIDTNDAGQNEILKKSTHFNPVDLICTTKNYKGEKFDLLKYREPDTGFISKKSKDGRELKAQELPGLWNGAMANWNTIFIEVPISTFNPVKTINDLLRKEHQ